MATVPTMHTFATGEVVTASNLNNNTVTLASFLLAPPLCVLANTGGQSFTAATTTAVTWDTEYIDRDNGHSTSTNPTRYTAQTAGWYSVSTSLGIGGSSSGSQRLCTFRVNGTTNYGGNEIPPCAGHDSAPAASDVIYLNVGDYVEVTVVTDVATSLDTGNRTRLTVLWVST